MRYLIDLLMVIIPVGVTFVFPDDINLQDALATILFYLVGRINVQARFAANIKESLK